MEINQRISDLVSRIAQEFNSIRLELGDITDLPTIDKTSLVASIQELKIELDQLDPSTVINDSLSTSVSKTWSVTKINNVITSSLQNLWTGVPVSHNTLQKIYLDLEDLRSDLAGTLIFTGSQSLTEIEKTQVRSNLGIPSSTELNSVSQSLSNLTTDVGDTTYDYRTDFNNALL